MSDAKAAFKEALQFHQAHNLAAAEARYRQVLAERPSHADAMGLLGALLLQSGRTGEGRSYLEKSVRLNPANEVARNNLGSALHELGDLPAAIREYRAALRINPRAQDPLNNLACALRESGDYAESERVFGKLLRYAPSSPSTLYNYALLKIATKQYVEAETLLSRLLEMDSSHYQARIALGHAMLGSGRATEAQSQFEMALRHNPDDVIALEGLADCKLLQDHPRDAIPIYARLLANGVRTCPLLVKLGDANGRLGDLSGAEGLYRRALDQAPQDAAACANLSALLRRTDRPQEALGVADAGLAAHPDDWKLRLRRGAALVDLLRLDEAQRVLMECHPERPDDSELLQALAGLDEQRNDDASALHRIDSILSQMPQSAAAHHMRGLVLLRMGRIEDGWPEYDWGTQEKDREIARRYPFPMWKGEPLVEKTILLYAEQGLGDEIQYASCFPELIKRGGRCIIQCAERLAPLFARSFPAAEVVGTTRLTAATWSHSDERIDYQSPAGSLPRYLRPTLADFPKQNIFLVPDQAARRRWRARLAQFGSHPKVGIIWRSGYVTPIRARNYTTLEQWMPVLRVPNLCFVCLQYDDCRDELAAAARNHGVTINTVPEIDMRDDLDGLAALIAELDLVIAAGTVVYNLAAAVGTPTWLLRSDRRDWIGLGSEQIPWYPAVEVFRQATPGDWSGVFERVARRLKDNWQGTRQLQTETTTYLPQEVAMELADAPKPNWSALRAEALDLHERQQWDAAEAKYLYALISDPSNAEVKYLLGTLLSQTGRAAEGLGLLKDAAACLPPSAEVYNNLGFAYSQLRLHANEQAAYREALRADPQSSTARRNLALALAEGGDCGEAMDLFGKLLTPECSDPELLYGLSKVQRRENRIAEQETTLQKVLALDPQHADAWNDLGVIFYNRADVDLARHWFAASLRIKPDNPDAMLNYGQTLDDPAETLEFINRAIALRPDFPAAYHNRSLAQLSLGRLAEAWRDWGWRLQVDGDIKLDAALLTVAPLWQGESLADKTLLIHSEQGLGDEILYSSCVAEIARQAKRVVLQCDERLEKLFNRSFPGVAVLGSVRGRTKNVLTENLAIDYQCPAGELPRYVRREISDFPSPNAYLVADAGARRKWRDWLRGLGGGIKVGIIRRSDFVTPLRARSYASPEAWTLLLRTEGVNFIDLYYGQGGDCAELERAAGRPIHRPPNLDLRNNLDETAALIAELDLVVASGTIVYNLAGALGVPTWLTRKHGREYIMLGTEHVPWYPTVRVFRQPRAGDWESVFRELGWQLNQVVQRAAVPNMDHEAQLREAVNRHPASAEFRVNYGKWLYQQSRFPDAEAQFTIALAIQPGEARHHYFLGNVFYQQGKYTEALDYFSRAVALYPGFVEALENRAATLIALNRHHEAAQALEEILARNPDRMKWLDALGTAYVKNAQLENGRQIFERAISQLGRTAERVANIGWTYQEEGDNTAAARYFEEALQIDPQNATAHHNLGMACLGLGDLRRGWREVAWRFAADTGADLSATYSQLPLWDGSDISEKTILVFGEQGKGDEIMYGSILPDLITRSGRCIIQCDARLEALYRRSFPKAIVHGGRRDEGLQWLEQFGHVDFQCPVGDLPRYFRNSIEDFPKANSYLVADPAKREHWRAQLNLLGRARKVGIVWRSQLHTPLRARSFTKLDQWLPLFSVPNVAFINLQYGDCSAEIATFERAHGVHIHQMPGLDLYNDFDGLAALMTELDLIIAMGTIIYNFGGALGVPTWLVRRFGTDWVMLGTDRIPWYPSVSVMRQRRPSDWSGLFGAVAQRLAGAVTETVGGLEIGR